MNKYLESHDFPDDLRKMDYDDLELLTYEIRDFLVEEVSKSGGHLSSNLGVVELSIALHRAFDTPKDKLIWDVGHQTYVHKILTGRAQRFDSLRKFGGMSGFPKMSESKFDIFDTGHSSTSLSLGLGLAVARDLSGEDYNVITVIGDGAMTGGLAFEALNNAGNIDTNMIVVLNDNGMSISPNTGGLSKYLGRLRSSRKYISMKAQIKKNVSRVPLIGEGMVAGMQHARDSIKYAVIDGVLFEELGFRYFGPVDGHDIKEMCETFELAKEAEGPVLIHVMTQKGRGYSKAENNPNVFHGIGPFDMETGQPLKKSSIPYYSGVFGNKLIQMAEQNEKIVAVSAAMFEGTGLEKFSREYPKRAFDVGIAEGHAVTFSAGLAKAGMKPFVAVYSTFLQRAYDEIMEDVCLQKLPVVFCIDRAGIVGADGETHHGIFDLSYLKHMPNLTVMAPKDGRELEAMMEFAAEAEGPCAIRYPRGEAENFGTDSVIEAGRAEVIREGKDTEIWAIGAMVKKALDAADILEDKGISAGVVNMRFLKPFDLSLLRGSADRFKLIFTLEDNVVSGGAGEEINNLLSDKDVKVLNIGWPDKFIEHGSCEELYEKYGMDANSIAERIAEKFER
ncbi:MAG TPA: 1-deoxy-D-xylulose-5-phosphate synthase [Candidatus Copromorpha excrementavium]|uniref:1-deoxy-D-xylulose-5-phosphate synthase n=1 Tax=Candidatus Allocopromorpha excrementavium TaxID=2840741 RepID=A0A9D1HEC3_9FIRM|nr:1-deoxy-D-xylulose-5-phosphate synthase [Candidatus Copromorpha excrementavium]